MPRYTVRGGGCNYVMLLLRPFYNPFALRPVKTLRSFDRPGYNRVKGQRCSSDEYIPSSKGLVVQGCKHGVIDKNVGRIRLGVPCYTILNEKHFICRKKYRSQCFALRIVKHERPSRMRQLAGKHWRCTHRAKFSTLHRRMKRGVGGG